MWVVYSGEVRDEVGTSAHLTQTYISPQKQNKTIQYTISIFLYERTAHNMRIAIYRKPTFTDTVIPYSSSHPTQI